MAQAYLDRQQLAHPHHTTSAATHVAGGAYETHDEYTFAAILFRDDMRTIFPFIMSPMESLPALRDDVRRMLELDYVPEVFMHLAPVGSWGTGVLLTERNIRVCLRLYKARGSVDWFGFARPVVDSEG